MSRILYEEVAGRNVHDDRFALVLAEQGSAHRRLVGDPALARACLGGTDDREDFLAVGAVDLHRRADLDVVGAVVAVDDRGVLDETLEPLDLAFDECLLVLGVLVLGILGEIAVLLGIVNPLGDLGTPDVDQFFQLGPQLGEALF